MNGWMFISRQITHEHSISKEKQSNNNYDEDWTFIHTRVIKELGTEG